MFELHQVGERSYYIESPAKIGIYRPNDTDVYLIDSGNDKDAGRKVRKLLDAHGWHLLGILNTHSNADHIGGNQYLQKQTGCKVFAAGMEAAFTEYPVLEPSLLYGGYPCKELRHKFLMASGSTVTGFSDPDFPKEVEVLPLKGHFLDMVGFRTPDNVVFLADCLSSQETLDKYKIGFIYDVAEYLHTLKMVKTLQAKYFVPSHAPVMEEIAGLAQYNIAQVNAIAEHILRICEKPIGFECILQQLFETYGLMMNMEQYVLVGSTVRSYLAWLKDTGKLDIRFENYRMLWVQKNSMEE